MSSLKIPSNVAVLTDQNAYTWTIDMENVLQANGLWHTIEEGWLDEEEESLKPKEEAEKTTSRPAVSKVQQANARALLLLLMQDIYKRRYANKTAYPTARSIWVDVKRMQSDQTAALVMRRRIEFDSLAKKPTESINEYCARAEDLAAQLGDAGEHVPETQVAQCIVQGLPAAYETVRAVLSYTQSVNLTLVSVRQSLMVEEIRQQGKPSSAGRSGPQQQALVGAGSFTKGGFSGKRGGRAGSRGGGRSSSRPGGRGEQKPKGDCHYCGKAGHYIRDCRHKAADEEASERLKQHASKRPSEQVNVAFVALSAQQHKPSTNSGQRVAGTSSPEVWYVDSGASTHVTNHRGNFTTYHQFDKSELHTLTYGQGQSSRAKGSGTVDIKNANGTVLLTLHNVWYVPACSTNLVSVSALDQQQGIQVTFKGGSCILTSSNTQQVVEAPRMKNNLYGLVSYPPRTNPFSTARRTARYGTFVATSTGLGDPKTWHRRLGHVSHSTLGKLVKGNLVEGIDDVQPAQFESAPLDCESCVLGKQVKQPFYSQESKSSAPLDLLHTDLCQQPKASITGSRYILTVLDDYTRYSEIRFLKEKSQVPEVLPQVIAAMELQHSRCVKAVRSDNGREYVNQQLSGYFKERGIRHETSVPYTPEQNGAAERLNRTLLETTRTLLAESDLPDWLWAEACHTANYMRNRTHITKRGKTPYNLYYGKVPDLSVARVFGSPAYVYVDGTQRSKLEPTSKLGYMVGYSATSKAYRILVAQKKVIEARNVIFDETPRPRKLLQLSPDDDEPELSIDEPPSRAAASPEPAQQQPDQDLPASPTEDAADVPEPTAPDAAPAEPAATPAENTGRSKYSLRSNVAKPQMYGYLAEAAEYAHLIAADAEQLPTTYEEAMAGPEAPQWAAAMEEELDSLQAHDTGVLVDMPPASSAKPISLKWVYTKKRDAAGNVERYKARLVARGFQQREGIDYDELFAPVGKYTTLRALLAMVAAEDMELHQLDFKTAFLNGKLVEEIYVQQPPGFQLGKPGQVLKLNKTLYGLKQAPRAWHQTLKADLEVRNFVESDSDPGLFSVLTSHGIVYLLTYVDDGLLAARSKQAVLSAKALLMEMFETRDLGEASLFLGMAIERDRSQRSIKLHQGRAVSDLLAKFGLEKANFRSTPLAPSLKLTAAEGKLLQGQDKKDYPSLVGSLNYLAVCTRPDISFAVGVLSRYLASPTTEHMQAAKGVLRYLAGTANHGLHYGAHGDETVTGYCDADMGGDLDTRRSTTGYTYILYGGAISWSSKRQESVALSTVEAEYMAAAAAVKEALWLRVLLEDLQLPYETILIHGDNQGSLQLIKNTIISARSKHIDIRYHFVRERVANAEVAFKYISTDSMVADGLTKSLPAYKHTFCKLAMGVY